MPVLHIANTRFFLFPLGSPIFRFSPVKVVFSGKPSRTRRTPHLLQALQDLFHIIFLRGIWTEGKLDVYAAYCKRTHFERLQIATCAGRVPYLHEMASNLFSDCLFPPQQQSKELSEMKQYFKKNGKIKDFQAHESKVSSSYWCSSESSIGELLCLQAHSVDWNSDGRKVASGSTDKTVSVFSLDRYGLVSRHQ